MGMIRVKYGLAEVELSSDKVESTEQLAVILKELLEANRALTNQQVKLDVLEIIEGLRDDLSRLKSSQRLLTRLNRKLSALIDKQLKTQEQALRELSGAEGSSIKIQVALKDLQYMNQSFRLQYLAI